MPIQIVKVTKLTDYKWLNLFDVEYLNKEGNTGHWTFASRKKEPIPGPKPIVADAVVIIPILKTQRERKLVVIKEYRIPLGDFEYGFPAGLYDHKESAEDVARRELFEETGLKLTKVLHVSNPCVSSAGLSDESVVYVVCECEGEPNTDANEGAEDIVVETLNLGQVRELRRADHKISAKALPFFMLFEGTNSISWPRHMIDRPARKKEL